jgi:hypothetical protein
MELIIVLLFVALFAWIGSEMAKTRNRSQITWAILSVIFGVFAIIVLALIGKVEVASTEVK